MTNLGSGNKGTDYSLFREAVQGLLRGDFSRLEPLFGGATSPDWRQCPMLEWYQKGYFAEEPKALEEAFTCACFLGRTELADFLLSQGVNPCAGIATGLSAFHWAASRAHLETVKLLIRRKVPLEAKNMYGGTVLGQTVWSAIHEPGPDRLAIIEALLSAGARLDTTGFPTGDDRIDQVFRRHGANAST
jgi:Ankyrin repeats (3 copies)